MVNIEVEFLISHDAVERRIIIASDIGPGNTLIDKFCLMRFNKYFDKNGLIASKEKVNYDLVNGWMKKKIFKKKPPGIF